MIILDQNSNGTVLTRYYCTIAADARTVLQIVVKPTTNECVTADPADEIVPLIYCTTRNRFNNSLSDD